MLRSNAVRPNDFKCTQNLGVKRDDSVRARLGEQSRQHDRQPVGQFSRVCSDDVNQCIKEDCQHFEVRIIKQPR